MKTNVPRLEKIRKVLPKLSNGPEKAFMFISTSMYIDRHTYRKRQRVCVRVCVYLYDERYVANVVFSYIITQITNWQISLEKYFMGGCVPIAHFTYPEGSHFNKIQCKLFQIMWTYLIITCLRDPLKHKMLLNTLLRLFTNNLCLNSIISSKTKIPQWSVNVTVCILWNYFMMINLPKEGWPLLFHIYFAQIIIASIPSLFMLVPRDCTKCFHIRAAFIFSVSVLHNIQCIIQFLLSKVLYEYPIPSLFLSN